MTDSSTPAVQPRVLDDPLLPDATDPVVGGDFGIPKRIYDEAPRGCKVVVDALVGQVGGERISLNLNGLEDLDSGYTQGPHDSVELHLPPGFLLHNAVNRLTYTVTSRGGAPETSPPLELLYNLIRPGNVDRSPGEPGHSELVLLLPDEIKNGVGPGFTRATVCVSYPYCRAYDTIRLNCNGKELTRRVLETEAPEPPDHGSPTPTTICFDVTSADLGPDHPEFVFSFTVTDQLGNTPDLNSPYSAEQLVDVDQAGSRLPMPILREVLTDTGDDPSIIDLDKLGTNPLLFVVLTADPRILPGDSIEGTYVVRVAGQPNITVPVSGTVETDDFGQKQVCILEVPNDKVIAGSSVQASYRVFRGIPLVGSSRTAFATVIGQGAPDVEPVITRIEDSDGMEIPEGTSTVDTTVRLTGTAGKGQKVDVLDGMESKGQPFADVTTGIWTLQVSGLSVTHHSFTAKALYGSNPESAAYTFTVVEPLSFGQDYSQTASNYFIVRGLPPSMPPDDATAAYTRTATGGVPPYRYTSSNEQVAIVTLGSGLVRAAGNGSARVTATDADGREASYLITFSGVRLVERVDGMWWDPNFSDVRPTLELHLDLAQMKRFWELYFPSEGPVAQALGWPVSLYWTSDGAPGPYALAFPLNAQSPVEATRHGSEIYPAIKKL